MLKKLSERKLSKTIYNLSTDINLEFDFILIGISSILKDYRLCHYVNKNSNFKLIFGKENPYDEKGNKKLHKTQAELDYHILNFTLKNKVKETHHFKTYRDVSGDLERECYMLINKSLEGRLLISETANFDAFLLIKHFIDEEDLSALLTGLNRVDGILLAKEIDPKILKSKENLIF